MILKYKKQIQIAVGILISALSLYFVFKFIDLDIAVNTVKNIKIKYVVISALISSSILCIRAIRWKIFIPIKKRVRKSSIIAATYIGYMSNNVLPAKLGEVVRVYVLGEKEGIKKTVLFASIVTERLFDLITSVIMLSIALALIPNMPKSLNYAFIVVFVLCLLGVCFLIFLSFKKDFAINLAKFFLKIFPKFLSEKIENLMNIFISGIGIKKDFKSILFGISATVIYWFLQILSTWFLLKAFSLTLPLSASLLIIVLVGYGFAIPSAPTGVGPIEAATIFALSVFSVEYSVAASFALFSHLISIVTITLLGIIAVFLTGIDIRKASK